MSGRSRVGRERFVRASGASWTTWSCKGWDFVATNTTPVKVLDAQGACIGVGGLVCVVGALALARS